MPTMPRQSSRASSSRSPAAAAVLSLRSTPAQRATRHQSIDYSTRRGQIYRDPLSIVSNVVAQYGELASADVEGLPRAVDALDLVTTRYPLPELTLAHPGDVDALSFSPDGRFMATIAGYRVRIWDATEGTQIWELGEPSVRVPEEIGFIEDGGRLVIVDGSHFLVADTRTGEIEGRLPSMFYNRGRDRWTHLPDRDALALLTWGGLQTIGFDGEVDLEFFPFADSGNEAVALSRDAKMAVLQVGTSELEYGDPLAIRDLRKLTLEKPLKQTIATPEGDTVLLAYEDGSAELRELETGRVRPLASPPVRGSYGFSGDGQRLLVRRWDELAVEVHDVPSANFVVRIESGYDAHTALLDHKGQRVVTFSRDDARVWDVRTGELRQTCMFGDSKNIQVALDRSGERLAVVRNDAVLLWGMSYPSILHSPQLLNSVDEVRMTPDGSRIIAAGDRKPRVWNTKTWARELPPLRQRKLPDRDTTTVDVSPDGRVGVTNDGEEGLIAWDLGTDELRFEANAGACVTKARFWGNERVVTLSASGLDTWGANDGTLLEPSLREQRLEDFDLDRGGRVLVAAGEELHRWTRGSWQQSELVISNVQDIALSPDGQLVALFGADELVVIDDSAEVLVRREVGGAGRWGSIICEASDPTLVVFSGDGAWLAHRSVGDAVELWRVGEWTKPRVLDPDGTLYGRDTDFAATTLAFSPRGDELAVGYAQGALRRFSLVDGVTVVLPTFRSLAVRSLSYSSDGGVLVAGSDHLDAWRGDSNDQLESACELGKYLATLRETSLLTLDETFAATCGETEPPIVSP